jgi:hypothetical protein
VRATPANLARLAQDAAARLHGSIHLRFVGSVDHAALEGLAKEAVVAGAAPLIASVRDAY